MRSDIILDAIGMLDDDLIEKHFEAKKALAEKPKKSKGLSGVLKRMERLDQIAACIVMITVVAILIIKLASSDFSKEWVDKSTATYYDGVVSKIFVITEIQNDCFYAKEDSEDDMLYKINGSIKKEYCIGDSVVVEFNNIYTDSKNGKVEGDLVNISLQSISFGKPVIYLYPEVETEVSVRLTLDGKLTCTYPEYNDGWKVTASPDGTLTDENGKVYNYLYWEGVSLGEWDFSKGFCVKGEDTAEFLEDALAKLGLNRREANEFIVYWLPIMQENEYNIISFQGETYTDFAVLDIDPAPDTLIRVFMAFKAYDAPVDIAPQELSAPERVGFTVVEWGGGEAK